MHEFTGFEPPPNRRIWPTLIAAADLPRLKRMLQEAHQMMETLQAALPSDIHLFRLPDKDWGDLARAIEAEIKKRIGSNQSSLAVTPSGN